MISMGTIEELHSQNHTLALYCLSCNRWSEANLEWLIQIGKGNQLVTDARFRCRDCGEIVEKQVRLPVPSLGEAVAYIYIFLATKTKGERPLYPGDLSRSMQHIR